MNTFQARYQAPQMKASDADRDAVVSALSEHYQAGRLTTEELEDRTGRALAARTFGEPDTLTADLPGPVPSARSVPSQPEPGSAGPVTSYGPPVRRLLPLVIAVVVVIAIADVGFSFGTRHNGDGFWWIIPVAFVALRLRAFGRRNGRFRGNGRDF
jgi:hypothetical protein